MPTTYLKVRHVQYDAKFQIGLDCLLLFVWHGMVWYMSIYIALLSQKSLMHWTRYCQVFRPCLKDSVLLCAEVVRQGVPDHRVVRSECSASIVDSWCRGTTVSCCVADLRRCLPTTSVTGVQQSTRYCGALPCRHLCMMTMSLYVTRSATSSQCKSSCKIWVRPWSNFLLYVA